MVTSSKVSVTAFPQLSLAVAVANSGTAGQFIVEAAGSSEMTGATVSLIVIVCDTEEVFPQASAKVHVRTIVNELAQVPGVTTSTPATVIDPLQLSVAVSETMAGTSAPQEAVMSAGATGTTGATVSLTLIVCETDDVFPQTSVNVHVLTIV